MEYYNGVLCITGWELISSDKNPDGFIGINYYRKLTRQNRIKVLRRGCYATPALIMVDSLPPRIREQVYKNNPDYVKKDKTIVDEVEQDGNAIGFFANYMLENGRYLSAEKQLEYVNNASILNTFTKRMAETNSLRLKVGEIKVPMKLFFTDMAERLKLIADVYPNTLPENPRRLENRYKAYVQGGYATLVSRKFQNQNSRKVSGTIEQLVMSIYSHKTKPFNCNVTDFYKMFIDGKVEIVNIETGELFNRADFMKNGVPVTLSDSTVWNILNKRSNRIVVDSKRNDKMYNSRIHEPHHHRRSPEFSFSKISMDDIELVRKTSNGEKVAAYYAYDVASGVLIGAAYSIKKDLPLVYACFKDMFRFIDRNGLGMPIEVEVEHHLMNKIVDTLQAMFKYQRWCVPGNSKEKRAEHNNKSVKYTAKKQLGQGNGRWYSKHEAYLSKSERDGAEMKEIKLPYEQLIAEDQEAIRMYNNAPHPDKAKYNGKTRMQVLLENQNPNVVKMDRQVICRYIGERTDTSIRHSQYMQVQYNMYQLPTVECLELLQPNNMEVTAYYLPEEDGTIPEVHVYQGDTYIGACKKIVKYNEARPEHTEADIAAIAEQSAYTQSYRDYVKKQKQEKIQKVKLMSNEVFEEAEKVEAKVVPLVPEPEKEYDYEDYDATDYAAKAFNSI